MQKTKHLTVVLIFLLLLQFISAQKHSFKELAKMDSTRKAEYFKAHERKVDSLSRIDYLSYEYKYLHNDFTIEMSPRKFTRTVKKYGFMPGRIDSYKDSLGVALMAEFNDRDQVRIAELKILYSWLRLEYHTWQTPVEAKDFAAQFGITHPWRMKEFLVDENNNEPHINNLFEGLKVRIEQETGKAIQDNMSRDEILNRALRYNPERIIAFKKRREEIRRKRQEAKP